MNLSREVFARVKSQLGVTAVDATADSIAVNGESISFVCVTGNIWINPLGTAVADATCFKLTAGDGIDLLVDGNLSIISDGSGGEYQYIIWRT